LLIGAHVVQRRAVAERHERVALRRGSPGLKSVLASARGERVEVDRASDIARAGRLENFFDEMVRAIATNALGLFGAGEPVIEDDGVSLCDRSTDLIDDLGGLVRNGPERPPLSGLPDESITFFGDHDLSVVREQTERDVVEQLVREDDPGERLEVDEGRRNGEAARREI